MQFLDNNRNQLTGRRILAMSLSPQSLASLGEKITHDNSNSLLSQRFRRLIAGNNFSIDSNQLDMVRSFVAGILHEVGAHLVIDTTWTRDITLEESVKEFLQRFSATESGSSDTSLPLFCGICPGWICYAEKTHSVQLGSSSFSIVPHLSTVRSPQQITGRLLKSGDPHSIYHVSVMPCFDKKLEASRSEFATVSSTSPANEESLVPDVDLVLATNELFDLLENTCKRYAEDTTHDSQTVIHDCPLGPPDLDVALHKRLTELIDLCGVVTIPPDCSSKFVPMYRHIGTGSGGYASVIFCRAAFELFGIRLVNDPQLDEHVLVRQLHNRDLQEWLLFASVVDRDNAQKALLHLNTTSRTPYRQSKAQPAPLLAFAVANGFRNIQNIVQPLKTAHKANCVSQSSFGNQRRQPRYPFDYVEVMACPGGCLNGGGQLKNASDVVTELYFQLPALEPMQSHSNVRRMYNALLSEDVERRNLRTSYRSVPPVEIINPMALQW
ncbi:Cytosolic Fe-S cluster assembly factor NARFL [Paragonimus heterotremus]|uniref:Cytosolic Fe-S cluster assembly factor NARFL n=1 Tax=Paragonimus heterotremus TaxID=100268 RepID=A0A8J4T7C2_9TREM|nr:Cytosolic Fe-S cluster assembly factor NARFL [Paragonimus heterotremus]